MTSFPSGGPQAERVELERVLGSVQAVNTCLPQTDPDSGTSTATAGLLNSCSTLASGLSVFVLQTQVALCWLWSQISALAAIVPTNLLEILDSLQAQISAIPSMRTPGALNITVGVAAGAGATASIVGNDTAGQILLTTGTGTSSGEFFTTANVTPFTTAGILHLEAANLGAASESVPLTTTDVNGTVVNAPGSYGDTTDFVWNYVILGGT